jgi:hypothetical protein
MEEQGVIPRRKAVSEEAQQKYAADVAIAERFGALFEIAQAAERELREAQAAGAEDLELGKAGKRLDTALTDVMRAAFAAERVAIGPRGYDDRIYRRKALATSKVRMWSMEAQRLLTLRESHRLTGLVRLPRTPAA